MLKDNVAGIVDWVIFLAQACTKTQGKDGTNEQLTKNEKENVIFLLKKSGAKFTTECPVKKEEKVSELISFLMYANF